MFFLFSGEGPTDLGSCNNNASSCDGEDYLYGPMTMFVDKIVQDNQAYSLIDAQCFGFVSESALSEQSKQLKAVTKGIALPGKKREKETRYFFDNARAFARIAQQRAIQLNDEVVAVLFRDSDGTATPDRGLWPNKHKSMMDGFEEQGFSKGVPMIPKPKSEAWILCALKYSYQHCHALEERSGNDNSPNSLKQELEEHLEESATRTLLNQLVGNGQIDCLQLRMPSFQIFRDLLEEVI